METMERDPLDFLASQRYVGGVPQQRDLIPSICFLSFHVLLLLRRFKTDETAWPIFQAIRMATFVLRLGLAVSWWGSGMQLALIIETAMIGVGFFALAGGAILFRFKLNAAAHPRLRDARTGLTVSLAIVRWLFFACVAIELAAAAIMGVYLYHDEPQLRDTPRILRRASSITGVIVAGTVFIMSFSTIHSQSMNRAWPGVAVGAATGAIFVAALFAVIATHAGVHWVTYYILHAGAEVFALGSMLFVPGDWYTTGFVRPLASDEVATAEDDSQNRISQAPDQSLMSQTPSQNMSSAPTQYRFSQGPPVLPPINQESSSTPLVFTVYNDANRPISTYDPPINTSLPSPSPAHSQPLSPPLAPLTPISTSERRSSHILHPVIDMQQASAVPPAAPATPLWDAGNVIAHGPGPRADTALPTVPGANPVVTTILPWWQRRRG